MDTELDLSAFDTGFGNDAAGASACDSRAMLKIRLPPIARARSAATLIADSQMRQREVRFGGQAKSKARDDVLYGRQPTMQVRHGNTRVAQLFRPKHIRFEYDNTTGSGLAGQTPHKPSERMRCAIDSVEEGPPAGEGSNRGHAEPTDASQYPEAPHQRHNGGVTGIQTSICVTTTSLAPRGTGGRGWRREIEVVFQHGSGAQATARTIRAPCAPSNVSGLVRRRC